MDSKRKLKISHLRDRGTLPRALELLTALEGVKEARADEAGKWIRLRYDLDKIQYSALIQALENEDLLKKPGLWERLRRGWLTDQDCVARDNARAKPSPCCSNPTGIIGQSGKKRR